MKKEITGIKRKERYSPNHITNDSLVLLQTGEVLKEYGYSVNYFTEDYIEEYDIESNIIFSMVQGMTGIQKLLKYEKKGCLIVNRPESSFNCHRIHMTEKLMNASVPFPKSIIIENDAEGIDFFKILDTKKIWLKRGDVHAEHKEDVSLTSGLEELYNTLADFRQRGIKCSVVQEHLPGDVIKFYAVSNSDFFYWYYLNGANKYPFTTDELRHYAFLSAEILGLDIFGGDAVISSEGFVSIIDINDWPSFAPVRNEAAKIIGKTIHQKVINYVY
jgi:glutathione synthase/RimK-type ligase-like ATP-grasp enzyme